MDIHIHVDDWLTTLVKRLFAGRRGAAIASVSVLAVAGAVWAVTDTGDFVDGTPISAKAVNDRFKVLFDGVNALQAQVGASPVTSVSAKYTGADGTSIGTAATTIRNTTKAWDYTNSYNTATGGFTCPSTGLYRVEHSVESAGSQGAQAIIDTYAYVDGASVSKIGVNWAQAGHGANIVGGGVVNCAAGQVITVRPRFQTAGAADNNGATTWSSFTRLGDSGPAVSFMSVGGKKYSLNANSAKATTAKFTGNIGGSDSAKVHCEAAFANSPTAHMCTAEEMLRLATLGVSLPNAWYSAGLYANVETNVINDCGNWTNGTNLDHGPVWTGYANIDFCANTNPIACCDFSAANF